MKKLQILLVLILNSNLVSQTQYDWEPAVVTQIETQTFGNSPSNDWDMAVDNFGLHFIGLYNLSGFDGKGTLKYTLVDNYGVKLDDSPILEHKVRT